MSDDPGEQGVIHRLLSSRPALAAPPVDAGSDDACVLEDGLVVSTDAFVAGVHWDDRWSAADVGWRVVAASVSDLGAMGVRPDWLTLALALPRPLAVGWLDGFCAGLGEALARFHVRLVGGDTLRAPVPMVSVTVGGHSVHHVPRSGGRPGDLIWITGRPGLAALGFHTQPNAALLRPQPPVGLGVALGENGLATAMMDLSDGLATDLPRLCAASGVGARVRPHALPPLPGCPAALDMLALQVAFGDDYELLFTTAPEHAPVVRALAAAHGTAATAVGVLTDGAAVELEGCPWPAPAFTHFGAQCPTDNPASPPPEAPC
jgi:thiamine-monophosphate kinase